MQMANEEHLTLLKQGVEGWNRWRRQNPTIHPDLSRADLLDANLRRANLLDANLHRANLHRANLRNAYLNGADLSATNLSGADLSGAYLNGATLRDADLSRADLSGAEISRANLSGADLSRADLSRADLSRVSLSDANLNDANLRDADLNDAQIGWTIFNEIDLQSVKGLETIEHHGPSGITTSTLERSGGNIPEVFLRKAGVGEGFITYARSLVATPIEYYTCFLSYSKQDQVFAERLYNDLQGKGVRCWYAPKELKPGDYYRHKIDESIPPV
jgi:hypothetical protein